MSSKEENICAMGPPYNEYDVAQRPSQIIEIKLELYEIRNERQY